VATAFASLETIPASLADRAGVRQATISQVELGTTRIDLNVLDRLCAVLEVDPGELLDRNVTPRPARGKWCR